MPIQFRRDTAANWSLANTVLDTGEPAFERDTGSLKIGDGTRAYMTLPYVGSRDANSLQPGGRLSGSSTIPIIPNESSAYSTSPIVYYVPYVSDRIVLWDGTKWQTYTFTSATQLNLNALPVSGIFDIFAYQNNGVVALTATQWLDFSTRLSNLVLLNGIMVKSGNAAHRYLGTIVTNDAGVSANTTVADTYTNRNIYNYYNQVPRVLLAGSTSANIYTDAAWRLYNGIVTPHLSFVAGAPSALSISYSGKLSGGAFKLAIKSGNPDTYLTTNTGATATSIVFSTISPHIMPGDVVAQTGSAGLPVKITSINRTNNTATLNSSIVVPSSITLRGDSVFGQVDLTRTTSANIETETNVFASSTGGVGYKTINVLQFGAAGATFSGFNISILMLT